MSEYQCYEFLALDRPLTTAEMAQLRDISSRAEISTNRFWNEYHWGSLNADPQQLLASVALHCAAATAPAVVC